LQCLIVRGVSPQSKIHAYPATSSESGSTREFISKFSGDDSNAAMG
jgi:hypothetical protein